MNFLAKSYPVETLREHTDNVLLKLDEILLQYGDLFSSKEIKLIQIACEYHDYGKIEKIFQDVICHKRRTIEMPHGFLSGLFLSEDANEKGILKDFSKQEIGALYTAIHYHHTRNDERKDAEYKEYALDNLKENYEAFTGRKYCGGNFRYLRKRLFINNPAVTHKSLDEDAYLIYLLIKGILNKADYAASSGSVAEIPARAQLTAKVTDRFRDRSWPFRPAQLFMREHRNENIVVIAPVGSGKTEGALLWLDNAKGFYTLPLKVSAGAIYHRIYDTPSTEPPSSYGFKEVGLLHSDSISEYLSGPQQDATSDYPESSDHRSLTEYRAVKSLAFPLTITTVDQLFKFVFKALGTEIFAATLKYSKVIIDEMQMYNANILAMLVYGLKTVSRMGGKFAIITATLPEFVQKKLQEENVPFAYEVFHSDDRRHHLKMQPSSFSESFDIDAIREAGKTCRVLVICNTVRKAQELKKQLPEAGLLHSRFIKKERDILEKRIIEFQDRKLHPDSVGIWISTQLVEASLDIDFDILHTEMCTADSLLQRLGRCFRSRAYNGAGPNIFLYDHGPCGIYDEIIFSRSKELLKPYEGRIFTEAEKLDYINAVFNEEEIKGSKYYKDFQKRWEEIQNIQPTMYTKQEADKLFRDISSISVISESVYNRYRDLVETSVNGMNNKEIPIEERYEHRLNLEQLTISIDPYSRDGTFVDKTPIPGTGIFRTRAVYSSIEDTQDNGSSGLGLLREEQKDDNFL